MARKPYFDTPEAEGKFSHEIDWRGTPMHRLKNFFFFEGNLIRTIIVVVGAFALLGAGVIVYVVHHFMHKYW